MKHQYKSSGEFSATPISQSPARPVHVDDDWLEAILDNLALANLSRSDCVELIEHLENWESADVAAPLTDIGTVTESQVVGDRFESEFNDFDMRSPDAMTGENVIETLERAIRGLGMRGHVSAIHQIVFFVSSNLDEVVIDADDEEPSSGARLPLDP
jgi:hypothetical protein